ncbi:hypothetical protein [Streptomyces sp. MS1.AVA.4]|uniref:Uncharacterized protein n=2 Tax=Streptomyces pratisoli TaxID=3139917 RepID=A0ACC6QVA9_9ACTN
MTTRRGPQRGAPRQGRRISYDPASGQAWRTGVVLLPDEAAKVIKAAELSNISVAGLLGELIQRMEIDAAGRPLWAHELRKQEELPKAG